MVHRLEGHCFEKFTQVAAGGLFCRGHHGHSGSDIARARGRSAKGQCKLAHCFTGLVGPGPL